MNGFYHLETGRCGGSLFELSRAVDRSPIAAAQLDRPIVRDAAAARQRGDAGHMGGRNMEGRIDTLEASQAYRDTLRECVRRMPPELRDVYDRYAGQLVCLDASFPGTSHFSPAEGGFRVNETADLANPFGAGNAFFHESAHVLDYLMGREHGTDGISTVYRLTEAAEADLEDALSSIMGAEGCSYEEAQGKLSAELASHMKESACVSDVFGGLTGNRVVGISGHSADYWALRGCDAVGREAFAEITADSACNPAVLAYTQKMMPRTYAAYQRIMEKGGRV